MPDLSLVPTIPPELKSFLSAFGTNHIFCSIKGDIVKHYPGTLEDHYRALHAANKDGAEIFFTVNKSQSDRRIALDIIAARAVFIDDDRVSQNGPKTDFPLDPSIVLESSPGKFHYYWLTSTHDMVTWKLVQKGLIATYDTDPAIHDLPRVLRLPTFTHRNGSVAKVIINTKAKYSWTDILSFFPPIIEHSDRPELRQKSDFSLVKTIAAFTTGESIAPSLNSLIMHWAHRYSASVIKEQVQDLFDSLDQETYQFHSKRYEGARSQVDKFIKTAKNTANKESAPSIHFIGKVAVPKTIEWDWSLLKSNPLPEDAIPDTLLEAAEEIGNWTATGKDPAILSAVFLTSALLGKNILIHEIGDSLTTHCQCGIVIVMDTGARKSSIYEQMNKPFFEYEQQLIADWEKEKTTNEAMVKLLDMQVKQLEQESGKEKNKSISELLSSATAIGKIVDERDKIQVKKPWLRSSDVTEEKLVRKLAENNGTIAIISDDARQVMSNLRGRYSNDNTGESVYINALTGSDILYERVGSEKEIHIVNPVLNALLFVQPDAALSLKNSDMYIPSGLAARLPMYFYPVSGADIVRNTERRPINTDKMAGYYKTLRALCLQRYDNPLHIRINDSGMVLCRKMDKEFADLLDSKWQNHYDKLNKLITLTMMYSTVFAALDDEEFRIAYRNTNLGDSSYTIPLRYLNMGFMFAKALFSQAIISYDDISNEAVARNAQKVIKKLIAWYDEGKLDEGFTDCGALQNRFSVNLRGTLSDSLSLLLKKDWLYVTVWDGDSRKLNGGFIDKAVHPGDFIYHLNVKGIRKYDELNIHDIEKSIIQAK